MSKIVATACLLFILAGAAHAATKATKPPTTVDVFLLKDKITGKKTWKHSLDTTWLWSKSRSTSVTNPATCVVNHLMDSVGWDGVVVTTSNSSGASIEDQAYAAGYAEGVTTKDRIWQSYYNSMLHNGMPLVQGAVLTFVDQAMTYMDNQVNANPTDPYWKEVGLVLLQLQGMSDGYNTVASSSNQLTRRDLFSLNYQTELAAVSEKVAPEEHWGPVAANTTNKDGSTNAPHLKFRNRHFRDMRCSAMVKVTPTDLYMTHATWGSVTTMIRQLKEYRFSWVPTVKFSSYPGFVHSDDDWYMLSSGLAVQETTNENYNTSLVDMITPQCVSEFIRVVVANRMAVDGPSWATTFGRENSGTYNNQWMVVNMPLFQPGNTTLTPGLFTVLEQMPTLIHWEDQTARLQARTYWSSYNIPYYMDIRNISMNTWMAEQYGDFWNYTMTSRAQMFDRGAPGADTLDKVKALIRYNDCPNDPLCACPQCFPHKYSYGKAIAARCDLANVESMNMNDYCSMDLDAIDAKLTSYTMMQGGTVLEGIAQNGPSYDSLPVFEWDTWRYKQNFTVIGMPNRFEFPWVNVSSVLPSSTRAPARERVLRERGILGKYRRQ